MAFTVTTMTYLARKRKIAQVLSYINELNEINEQAEKLRVKLVSDGQSDAEVGSSVNKVLAAAGPPLVTAATDLAACAGDTISDRAVNLLSSLAGIGWSYLLE
jgi:hypothetical protein